MELFTELISLLTPSEWRGLLWLAMSIFSGTETVKRVYRVLTKRYTAQEVYFTSFLIGFVTAYFVWPGESTIPWFIVGLTAGPASSWAHKIIVGLIRWKYPGLAAAITGDRRKIDIGGPSGIQRRRQ